MTLTNDILPVLLGETEFQRFKTRSLSAAQKYLRDSGRTRTIEADNESGFSTYEHYKFPIGQLAVSLLIVHCEGGFRIVKPKSDDNYLFEFPLQGSCRFVAPGIDACAKPGDMFVVLPGHAATQYWDGHIRTLIVEVTEWRLRRALAAEVGEMGTEVLSVPPVSSDLGVAQWLQHMIGLNLHYGAQNDLFGNARVGSQLERTLLSMLFANVENSNARGAGRDGGVVPYYIRRAEAFVKAHYTEPISIEDIAAAACIGSRSLYYGFQQALDTTPMAYLRTVRLAHARRELEQAVATGRSVADIAVEAGFVNFSHFAKVYRQSFGESPTQTMQQATP